jgi:putative hydrolase of the HAD superfamily
MPTVVTAEEMAAGAMAAAVMVEVVASERISYPCAPSADSVSMTPAQPISLVVFDLDGVFYDFFPARRLAYLADLTGKDAALIRAAIWESDFESSAEAGAYPTGEAYLQEFNRRLGFTVTRAQWVEARRRAMTPRPAMLALLASLRPRIPLAVLTNNGSLLRETLPLLAPELHALLGDRVHVTADFGARKPDPLVFTRLAARYRHRPASILFVDDGFANVAGARAAGLQAALFESEQQIARLMEEILPPAG